MRYELTFHKLFAVPGIKVSRFCLDRWGHIIACDIDRGNSIVKLDMQGNVLCQMHYKPPRNAQSPLSGFCSSSDNTLVIAYHNHPAIFKVDLDRKSITETKISFCPRDIAIDAEGNIYIHDIDPRTSCLVHKFTPDLRYTMSFLDIPQEEDYPPWGILTLDEGKCLFFVYQFLRKPIVKLSFDGDVLEFFEDVDMVRNSEFQGQEVREGIGNADWSRELKMLFVVASGNLIYAFTREGRLVRRFKFDGFCDDICCYKSGLILCEPSENLGTQFLFSSVKV